LHLPFQDAKLKTFSILVNFSNLKCFSDPLPLQK